MIISKVAGKINRFTIITRGGPGYDVSWNASVKRALADRENMQMKNNFTFSVNILSLINPLSIIASPPPQKKEDTIYIKIISHYKAFLAVFFESVYKTFDF